MKSWRAAKFEIMHENTKQTRGSLFPALFPRLWINWHRTSISCEGIRLCSKGCFKWAILAHLHLTAEILSESVEKVEKVRGTVNFMALNSFFLTPRNLIYFWEEFFWMKWVKSWCANYKSIQKTLTDRTVTAQHCTPIQSFRRIKVYWSPYPGMFFLGG